MGDGKLRKAAHLVGSSTGTSVQFTPRAGQRWQWVLVAQLSRPVTIGNGQHSVGSWVWATPGATPNDPWMFVDPDTGALTRVPVGDLVIAADSAVFRQTILQTAAPDEMRGRLQGVFIVVVAGGPRLGELVLGAQATWVGEAWAAVVGGVACVVVLWLVVRAHRRFWRYDALHPEP